MATTTLAPAPRERFFNAFTLAPLSGGYLYTFTAGTQSPLTTYQDAAGLTPNSNPIVLDPTGSAVVYLTLGQSYKFIWTDGSAAFPQVATAIVGVVQGSQDNILAVPPATPSFDIAGLAGVTIAANQAAYLSDGSGGLNAGQWYLADASKVYSSSANLIGLATSTISAGMTGSFRVAGQLGGFAGLVAGSLYYVGTAGALQTTAGTFVRLVGQADSTTDLVIVADPPSGNQVIDTGVCDGRVTLTSLTPVPPADVIGATSIYFTPYQGNRIALYDGVASWALYTFSEITLALGTLTAAIGYDVFAYNNNGLVAIEVLAWASGTTRATAVVLQDGVRVKSGATTRRLVGAFYTTATTTTEDSAAKRLVWNNQNPVPRALQRLEVAGAWTYTTATWRQANANTANQIAVFAGIAELPIQVTLIVGVANTNVGVTVLVTIGVDSTTAASSGGGYAITAVANAVIPLMTSFSAPVPIGYHFYSWNEQSAATGTTTWNGTSFVGVGTGLTGLIWA